MPSVSCETCSIDFAKPECWLKRTKHNYCSKSCHDAAQTRRIKKTCKVCGAVFYIRPAEAKKFSTCSIACMHLGRSQERNPNWRGGTAKPRNAAMATTKYKQWRKAIFIRDNYSCVFCGNRGGTLNADHIKPWAFFPELRYVVDNGRTLCLTCHKTTYKENLQWRKM